MALDLCGARGGDGSMQLRLRVGIEMSGQSCYQGHPHIHPDIFLNLDRGIQRQVSASFPCVQRRIG